MEPKRSMEAGLSPEHFCPLPGGRAVSGDVHVVPETQAVTDLDRVWNVVVWDDPVNLMSYVEYVLQRVFGYPRDLARKLMLEVHNQGKSLVASESREQAELHVHQLHQYGLRATLQRAED